MRVNGRRAEVEGYSKVSKYLHPQYIHHIRYKSTVYSTT